MLNPFVDCGLEFRDVVENASPYTLSGDFGEEPLDEVEPGAGRRREVQDETFASFQPAFHCRCFVGGVSCRGSDADRDGRRSRDQFF